MIANWRFVVLLVALACSACAARESNKPPEERKDWRLPEVSNVEILEQITHPNTLVLNVALTIKNNNEFVVKDITVHCQEAGQSGTFLRAHQQTFYRTLQPGEILRTAPTVFGFKHQEMHAVNCMTAVVKKG